MGSRRHAGAYPRPDLTRHRIPPYLEARVSRLSPRDLLVLQHLARGHSPAQIATLTATNEAEVERVLTESVRFLGVPDRTTAVAVLRQLGLIV